MKNLSNEELIDVIRNGTAAFSLAAEQELSARIASAQQAFDKIVEIANKMLEGK